MEEYAAEIRSARALREYRRGCASVLTARAPDLSRVLYTFFQSTLTARASDLEYTRAVPSVPSTTLAQPPGFLAVF